MSLPQEFTSSIITLNRKRRTYPVDPCLGFYTEGAIHSNFRISKMPHAKTPHDGSALPVTNSEHNSAFCVSALSVTPQDDVDDWRIPSPKLKSRSPVVTVETFLRESWAKSPKTYRKSLRSDRQCAAPITSARDDQGSEMEVPTTVLLTHTNQRSPNLVKPADTPSFVPEGKRATARPSRIISRHAIAVRLPHLRAIQEVRHPTRSSVGFGSRLPLTRGPILDLDFPLLQKNRKPRQLKRLRPQDIDFSKPLSLYDRSVATVTTAAIGYKPMTHWRTKEPFRAGSSTTASKNNNCISSRRGVLPLKFVSWEEHEEGLSDLKACRLGYMNESCEATSYRQVEDNNDI